MEEKQKIIFQTKATEPVKTVVEEQKVEAPKKRPAQMELVKNFDGRLTVTLNAHDFSTPPINIKFDHLQEKRYVPAKYALGVFNTPGALKQFGKGYFTFSDMETLLEWAEELGYYVDEMVRERKITAREIKEALRAGDLKPMKEILELGDAKVLKDVVSHARKGYNELNVSMIKLIEGKLNVSLTPVDLSE